VCLISDSDSDFDVFDFDPTFRRSVIVVERQNEMKREGKKLCQW